MIQLGLTLTIRDGAALDVLADAIRAAVGARALLLRSEAADAAGPHGYSRLGIQLVGPLDARACVEVRALANLVAGAVDGWCCEGGDDA